MSLKVVSGSAQALGIVVETAKAVVAVRAEKAAHLQEVKS